jgi:hypothetical protein
VGALPVSLLEPDKHLNPEEVFNLISNVDGSKNQKPAKLDAVLLVQSREIMLDPLTARQAVLDERE